ncbi:MAG: hypothetical protein WAL08_17830 [Candidatus Sulfotelmatobacter sp.]
MEGRYWLWLGARLVVAIIVVGWAATYLIPGGSGERQFQKALDAMKQVRSARVADVIDTTPTQHMEASWDLVCAQDAYRYRLHAVQSGPTNAGELNLEELHVGPSVYVRKSDDSWQAGYANGIKPSGVCQTLAQGADSKLLPDLATMIKRGIIEKGDKKTVNGVRCREWKVTMKGGPSRLEHDTVCLGLDDHLPYEMTVDWKHSRTTYTDYNASFQLELPTATLQPSSASSGSN